MAVFCSGGGYAHRTSGEGKSEYLATVLCVCVTRAVCAPQCVYGTRDSMVPYVAGVQCWLLAWGHLASYQLWQVECGTECGEELWLLFIQRLVCD